MDTVQFLILAEGHKLGFQHCGAKFLQCFCKAFADFDVAYLAGCPAKESSVPTTKQEASQVHHQDETTASLRETSHQFAHLVNFVITPPIKPHPNLLSN